MKQFLLCGLVLLNVDARAQQFVNAKVESHPASDSLHKQIAAIVEKQTTPAWIGYAVPIVAGNHRICCYGPEESHKPQSVRKGHCNLEGHDNGMNFQTNSDDENSGGAGKLLVLVRAADGHIGKLRVFTDDCELDAG